MKKISCDSNITGNGGYMPMRYGKLLLAALVLLCLLAGTGACMAEQGAADYEVLLPKGYDEQEQRYPVVYLLPQNGYAADDSGIAEKLSGEMAAGNCAPMIIVRPAFEPGMDLHEAIRVLAGNVDAQYRTIADRAHRVLMGTGTGGYLSYLLGLTQMDRKIRPVRDGGLFDCIVSIRGDFVSEENPWYAVYGDMHDMMEDMKLSSPDVFNGFYTYIDAPVDDPLTNMRGSTNDIGALFIGFGTGSAAHEYTVRPGGFDDGFLSESVLRAADRLTRRMFPLEARQEKPAEEPIAADETPVTDGDFQKIELMGDWKFMYMGEGAVDDPALLTKETTADWTVVRPAAGHWTKGYGNIGDQNVLSVYGEDYFDFFITGNGYYVKTFELPQSFDAQQLILSVGYVDDRCEVYLNGVRVGSTGMDEKGLPTGETTWAVHSLFEVDPAILVRGGENTLVVRAYNDLPYGAGGWYGGPVGLYSSAAYEQLYGGGASDRFYEETFESEYAARAKIEQGPIENEYLIYLPEGYHESSRRYPTVYMLHQFNSDHTSYRIDRVNELFDQGAAMGLFDEMIVVIPNSTGDSWWAGDWEKMITEELVPAIDAKYRTIRDARYRLTAGCSMGGQGAMAVALRNPDLFSGAVSFFGAFSYGGMSNPNVIASTESAEYMDSFSLYFICGNQDSYGFGVPAIELNQKLEKMGVNHRFFIDNGGHDGHFYLPNFMDAFSYVRMDMYHADDGVLSVMSGSVSCSGSAVHADVSVGEDVSKYFYTIPDSAYTKDRNPSLTVPLALVVVCGEEETIVYETAFEIEQGSAPESFAMDIELMDGLDASQDAVLELRACLFDRIAVLAACDVSAD